MPLSIHFRSWHESFFSASEPSPKLPKSWEWQDLFRNFGTDYTPAEVTILLPTLFLFLTSVNPQMLIEVGFLSEPFFNTFRMILPLRI